MVVDDLLVSQRHAELRRDGAGWRIRDLQSWNGTFLNACGDSYRPPTLTGNTSVLYLTKCSSYAPEGLTGDSLRFGLTEAAWVHELFHAMGAAPDCAPHQTGGNGHVSDDPSDLMWAGTAPWKPALLDVGRDDYWTPSSGACPGLLGSPLVA